MILGMSRGSDRTRTMCPASTATSVPAPMAIPISAVASAGPSCIAYNLQRLNDPPEFFLDLSCNFGNALVLHSHHRSYRVYGGYFHLIFACFL